jgi:hypothetical protein
LQNYLKKVLTKLLNLVLAAACGQTKPTPGNHRQPTAFSSFTPEPAAEGEEDECGLVLFVQKLEMHTK